MHGYGNKSAGCKVLLELCTKLRNSAGERGGQWCLGIWADFLEEVAAELTETEATA